MWRSLGKELSQQLVTISHVCVVKDVQVDFKLFEARHLVWFHL